MACKFYFFFSAPFSHKFTIHTILCEGINLSLASPYFSQFIIIFLFHQFAPFTIYFPQFTSAYRIENTKSSRAKAIDSLARKGQRSKEKKIKKICIRIFTLKTSFPRKIWKKIFCSCHITSERDRKMKKRYIYFS